ncbi:hypothetical protein chiPu_0005264 [Chiloscyllium punctatum]|uniref:Uncharacterized protein n=1 Tax=Chiloscyllium punctatum TaxID=137246 RepID=A0A401S8X7_CHIPU|nr:hypothetical protein [Chiloscyllium punctatum]
MANDKWRGRSQSRTGPDRLRAGGEEGTEEAEAGQSGGLVKVLPKGDRLGTGWGTLVEPIFYIQLCCTSAG